MDRPCSRTQVRVYVSEVPAPPLILLSFVEFISPAATRASIKRVQGQKYRRRQETLSDKAERIALQKEEIGDDELARDQVFA